MNEALARDSKSALIGTQFSVGVAPEPRDQQLRAVDGNDPSVWATQDQLGLHPRRLVMMDPSNLLLELTRVSPGDRTKAREAA